RAPGNLGWDIHFARKVPLPDRGERVVLVTDRRIGFWEASRRPRSIDYPFTVIELRLNRDGEGEGKLSLATKIIPDKENNIITLENYDIQPVLLTTVRRQKPSHGRGWDGPAGRPLGFSCDVSRTLVVTQPDERCVTEAAVARPLGERHLDDELRLRPRQRGHFFSRDPLSPVAGSARRQVRERTRR